MTPSHNPTSPESQGITGGSTATFTMREAAEVSGVSVSTLRRRRTELEDAGAVISTEGWQVPMTALIATGLIKTEGPGRETEAERQARAVADSDDLTQVRKENDQLKEVVDDLREQAQRWEVRAKVAEEKTVGLLGRIEELSGRVEDLRADVQDLRESRKSDAITIDLERRQRLAIEADQRESGTSQKQNGTLHEDAYEGYQNDISRESTNSKEPHDSNGYDGVPRDASPRVSPSESDTSSAGSTRRKGFFGRLFS